MVFPQYSLSIPLELSNDAGTRMRSVLVRFRLNVNAMYHTYPHVWTCLTSHTYPHVWTCLT